MAAAVDEGDRHGRVRRPRDASRAPWPHRRVAALAAGQHGVVSAAQLLGLGVTGRQCWTWECAGRLHRLHRGVYGVGFRPAHEHARWMAAVLACPEGAVVSHVSAARLHELIPWVPRNADVTVIGSGIRSRPGIRTHRCRGLLAVERTSSRASR